MSAFSADRPPMRRRTEYSRIGRRISCLLVGAMLACGLAPLSAAAGESAFDSASSSASNSASNSASRSASGIAVGSGLGAAPKSFSELLAGFSAMPGFEARFVEEKTLSLLAIPLRSEGRIYFAPPSFLLRDIVSPQPQRVLINASQVRLSGGGREEVIDLASRAEIRPLVESLVWLFTGDRAALESAFEISFAEESTEERGRAGEGWLLELSPKEAPLSQLIARLVIRGEGLGARQIDVEEVSGDRSEMHIFDVDPDRRFSSAEFESLFQTVQASDEVTGPDE